MQTRPDTAAIIDFSRAREQALARRVGRRQPRRSNDARRAQRFERNDRMFVQVILSVEEPGLVGSTLSSNAVNISSGGLQFRVPSALPVGALLDVWIDVNSRPGKFFLSGEVRWCRPNEDGSSSVGLELRQGIATDFEEWRAFHAEAEAR